MRNKKKWGQIFNLDIFLNIMFKSVKIKDLTPILVFLLLTSTTVFAAKSKSKLKWKELKSQHFIVLYKEAPKDYAENVSDMAEDYYREISKNLGVVRYRSWTWDDRAKIYIYDSSEDYQSSLRVAGWSHGVASPKDKVIRTFPAAHGFFDSTLPHELGHIIFREFIGFKARIPLWFEEGVAMYQEKGRRWGSHKAVKEFIKNGKFIPLEDLSTLNLNGRTDVEMVNLFYIESASIIQYLIGELGEQRFIRFCRKLKKGDPFEWTMKLVYVRFKTVKKLNKAWVEFIKNK